MASDPKIMFGYEFLEMLCKALDIDASTVQRVVIDAAVTEPVTVYVQRVGDERLLNVD